MGTHFNPEGPCSAHRAQRRVGYPNVSGSWKLYKNEAEPLDALSLEMPLSSRQNRARGTRDAKLACHISGAEDLLPAGVRSHTGADAPPSTTYVRLNDKAHHDQGRKKAERHLMTSDDLCVSLGSDPGSLTETTCSLLTLRGKDSETASTPHTPGKTSWVTDSCSNDSHVVNRRKCGVQM